MPLVITIERLPWPNFSAIHYFLPIISLRFSIRKVTNRMPKRYFLLLLWHIQHPVPRSTFVVSVSTSFLKVKKARPSSIKVLPSKRFAIT